MTDSTIEFDGTQSGADREWLKAIYSVALAATALVLPFWFLGSPSGHDVVTHLGSWMDVRSEWSQGILFPRWAEWANLGFGEPRFIFYPPATGFLGAALGSILPWKMVPGALIWLVLIIAGLGMFKLAKEWLSTKQALTAAVLFVVNPYNLLVIYHRGAFAELFASAFLPLVIWALAAIVRAEWTRVPVLALAFAAIWLTNAPAAVIATYSVALLLAVGCVMRRSAYPLLPGGLAMIAGFGLAAFYIVPAAWEQRWIDMTLLTTDEMSTDQNFLFRHMNNPEFASFNWKISLVAVLLMIITAAAIALSARQWRARSEILWMLAALTTVSGFMMLSLSRFLYSYLPQLRYLEFPWRWSYVLGMTFAFFAAAASGFKYRWLWLGTIGVVVCAVGLAAAGTTKWHSHDVRAVIDAFASQTGYPGINFVPVGADTSQMPKNSPLIQKVNNDDELVKADDVMLTIQSWSAEHKVVSVASKAEVTLALRLLNYPAWQVLLDGKIATAKSFKTNGQLLISIPEGKHLLEITFQRTRDRTVGGIVSAISFILFSFANVLLWRPRKLTSHAV